VVERVDRTSLLDSLVSRAPDLPIRRTSTTILSLDPGSTRQPRSSDPPAGTWYVLGLRAHALRLAGTLDELIAPGVLADRVQPHPYQVRVVQQALREKMSAAILADEVGLGKTIEAGLILKELMLRGIVQSALVVAPKALLSQWQGELREHFDEDFLLTDDRGFRGFESEDRVICSFQQFVLAFDRIHSREWDCLIVDEAHLLANPKSQRRLRAGELRARWRLLLTATPIQNKITDLYSLIDLVAPGRLGTLRHFINTYAADPPTCRAVVPGKVDELRAIAQEVMCRTRRAETNIAFAPRRVDTYLVEASPSEAAVNREVTDYLRAIYRRGMAPDTGVRQAHAGRGRKAAGAPQSPPATPKTRTTAGNGTAADTAGPDAIRIASGATPGVSRGALIREIVGLQQSLSSSPQAIAVALRSRAEHHTAERGMLLDMAARCEGLRSAKELLLLDALQRLGGQPALVFTLRLETARHLRRVIRTAGLTAECYVGELSGGQRRDLIERFNHGDLQTLIATDAGAEGLNLQQRCHVVVNYDLHWNPMKMEQRIGRVHRLGQTQEVIVANFALRDSIDEYVLQLLYQKINLFTMAIGQLESVLADVQDGELDVEERLLEVLLGGDGGDVRGSVEALGREIEQALGRQGAAESLTAGVLG
jgi:SNF2 family DNA or RNA helicase